MSQSHVNVTYAGPVPVDVVDLDAHHLPAWANPGAIIRDGAEIPGDDRHTCACGCSWRGPGGCWNCEPEAS